MDELIRLSLVSSVLPPLKVGKIYSRSQVNLLLVFPFGVGKSTLLSEIERRELGVKLKHWTPVSLMGTITKSGQIVPPSVIIGAGKTILIDEFHAIPPQLRVYLLALMEEQQVERSLGFTVPKPVKESGKYWSVVAEIGYLKFHIRASYIIATAYYYDSPVERMLASRTIQLWGHVRFRDLKVHLMDYSILDNIIQERKDLAKFYRKDKAVEFSEDEYYNTMDIVIDYFQTEDLKPEYVKRVTTDLLRAKAVYQGLNEDTDKAYKLLPIITAGVERLRLTPVDYRVLSILLHGEKSDDEVEAILGFNDVHESLEKLVSLKIVERVGNKYRIKRVV